MLRVKMAQPKGCLRNWAIDVSSEHPVMPTGRPYAPPLEPSEIIYEDEILLAVSKPSGLLSVPGKGEHLADCQLTRLEAVYPGIYLIHRLDCDTSGVIIFAKTKEAQRHISMQFEKRIPKKTYYAWVRGVTEHVKGEIDLPLIVDWPNRPRQMVDFENGKPARTLWRRVRKTSDTSLIKLMPETGRSHQLRVHMQAMGHPILGDTLYAPADAAPRLMLHAEELSLRHPLGGEWFTITAPLPADFHSVDISTEG